MLRFRCIRCGEQRVPVGFLRCHLEEADECALLSYRCPGCDIPAFALATRAQVDRYLRLGATDAGSPFPREINEPRWGPPISWDELLDFHNELKSLDELERNFRAA